MKVYLVDGMQAWRVWIMRDEFKHNHILLGDHEICGPNAFGFSKYELDHPRARRENEASIRECDQVFAWIDRREMYSAAWELGFAYAIGKPITIAFSIEASSVDGFRCSQCETGIIRFGVCDKCRWDSEYKSTEGDMWVATIGATRLEPCAGYENRRGFDCARDAWMHFIGQTDEWKEHKFDSVIEELLFKSLRKLGITPEHQVRIERTPEWRSAHGGSPQYFKLDFAIPEKMVAIECDGHEFHSSKDARESDSKRQRELEHQGWQVIRFTGTEITRNPDACAAIVAKFVK